MSDKDYKNKELQIYQGSLISNHEKTGNGNPQNSLENYHKESEYPSRNSEYDEFGNTIEEYDYDYKEYRNAQRPNPIFTAVIQKLTKQKQQKLLLLK